jgi:DNA-binding transcriptional regulator YiaG
MKKYTGADLKAVRTKLDIGATEWAKLFNMKREQVYQTEALGELTPAWRAVLLFIRKHGLKALFEERKLVSRVGTPNV